MLIFLTCKTNPDMFNNGQQKSYDGMHILNMSASLLKNDHSRHQDGKFSKLKLLQFFCFSKDISVLLLFEFNWFFGVVLDFLCGCCNMSNDAFIFVNYLSICICLAFFFSS